MIVVPGPLLKAIVDAAEAAYPEECCGLLVGGAGSAASVAVRRVVASPNRTPDRAADRFEIDPQIRFDLMRELDGGPDRIVGHYHSHPDQPAQPSARDLEMAFEPDLAWLIVAVAGGQAVQVTAHVVDADGRQFREVPLRTHDWGPYPTRPAADA